MIQKLISRATRTSLVTTPLILLLVAFAIAGDIYPMGYLTAITPFDARVRKAGCFDMIPAGSHPSQPRSIEEMFRVARSFRYVSDSGGDRWQAADETEARRAGDCEDKAVWLFAQLLKNNYYNVRLVIGKYRSIDKRFHVWVICSDRAGNTCLLDPTIQKRVWYLTATDAGFYKPFYAFDGQNRYRYHSN